MNGYPSRSYSTTDEPGRYSRMDDGDMMAGLTSDNLAAANMFGSGQSLDDIVSQNSKAMRRRSVPMHYGANTGVMDTGDLRRVSMMEFAGSPSSPLNSFQFDLSSGPAMEGIMSTSNAYPQQSDQSRRQSDAQLALNTQIANQNAAYGSMAPPGSVYGSPIHPELSLDMDVTSPYVAGGMGMTMDQSMDMNDPTLANMMAADMGPMSTFQTSGYDSPMITSPVQHEFPPLPQNPQQQNQSSDCNIAPDQISGTESKRPTPTSLNSSQGQSAQKSQASSMTAASANQMNNMNFTPELPPHLQQGQQAVVQPGNFPWRTPAGGFPSSMTGRPHMETQYKNIYSSSGFDLLTLLMKVASRPNPEINIGAVDLSCAFVVCDAKKDDNPIVYCSENFERLTGYTRHMILGRNCRFLQSPDGKVESGVKRKYVDDESVLYLKNMISARKEAQISLINYRRGGQPFMNLLTMIPVSADIGEDTQFFVGFQVDLVEQPSAINSRNPDGTYAINYQRGITMPPYIHHTPETSSAIDLGPTQSLQRDDVSALLLTYGSTDSEISRRMWDRILLENSDDVIHVLSLKGLFMYLSPSSRHVLEYEPSELTGTALSSVCHPSDIVPVTRELKDTSSGNSVNIVFRIRRKHSGYMWFECNGALHTEQGKGRKCIILVGRERPVYALLKNELMANGGIGENELWSKLSTSGMFLYVSTNVRALLDRQPDELVGTSVQSLMRQDSKVEFSRILELARVGKKASVKHDMINKRGQSMQAFTTIYPGDASEGQKPTFLIAQTRMLKFSRGGSGANQRPQLLPKAHIAPSESNRSGTSNPALSTIQGSNTPSSISTATNNNNNANFINTEGAAMTYSGHNGLLIGRQDANLASDENLFDELKTTRSTSWQYELRQMERRNKMLAEEVASLLAAKKKRKRRKGAGNLQKDCANCHTRTTPEWRRGPSGNRDLCNSCGLRWAKQVGKVSPRATSQASGHSDKASKSSASPLQVKAPGMPPPGESSGNTIPPTTVQAEHNASSVNQPNAEIHVPKVARRETVGSHGLSSVPEKIVEASEPPD